MKLKDHYPQENIKGNCFNERLVRWTNNDNVSCTETKKVNKESTHWELFCR